MSLIDNHFNILKSLEKLQEEFYLKEEYEKTKYVMGFKNFIFSELISLNVPCQTIKDIELDAPEFDYLVITSPDGNKYKCRRKFITDVNISATAPTANTAGGMSFAHKAEMSNTSPQNSIVPVPNTKVVEDEPCVQPEPKVAIEQIASEPEVKTPITEQPKSVQAPQPKTNIDLSSTIGFFQTDKILNNPNVEVKAEPKTESIPKEHHQEPVKAEPAKSEYYKELSSGKVIASIAYDDLTVDFKDVTVNNPITHTSTIVNITAAPMSVDDDAEKSDALFFLEGLSDKPILTYSTKDNPTAKIEHNEEAIGITGNWKNGVFGTNVMSLSNSTVDFSPEDELILNNNNHEIGHCIVEIPTISGKKVTIHGFPITSENNDKGTADAMLCIIEDGVYDVKHLSFSNPIYKLYNREFEAKIMAYWEGKKSFNLSVEVNPKQ